MYLSNLRILIILLLVTFSVFFFHSERAAETKTERNGFNVANSIIPADKILSGGPPRDGIPALNNPRFVASNEAGFLKPQDRIIGLVFNGEARAYPVRILNWHEIVNDDIKGKGIAVTYCPLCGTGVVYASDIKGKRYRFGVSGLLYNSDVLLYDHETESLWSQILSTAISGPRVNSQLTILPSSHTRWASWKKKHPETRVMSTNTGYKRDYQHSPYGEYDTNRSLYFPVNARSRQYHPKERVLGISIQGKHKSYPFVELARHKKSPLRDTFAGKELNVSFDAKNRDGEIKDATGKILPSINSFWFAWYAFHPDTEIYTARK